MSPALSLPTIFLVYVAVIATIVAVILTRFLSARDGYVGLAVLAIWLVYSGVLGYFGVVGDLTLPVPGVLLLVGPVVVAAAALMARSPVGGLLATRIPLQLLIGLQAFRIGVELTLHRLWELGSVPRLLTLAGGNVEILIGLSAPVCAWIAMRGPVGRRVALAWNILGLASLLNVVARAALSAPGRLHLIHAEVLNTALASFPYTFIPGCLAPLAMMLHMLTLRAIRAKERAASSEARATDMALP